MTKKLFRSEENKVLLGILGGVGEYFDVDPTIYRLFLLFFIFITGFFPGVVFYFVAALIVPQRNLHNRKTVNNEAE